MRPWALQQLECDKEKCLRSIIDADKFFIENKKLRQGYNELREKVKELNSAEHQQQAKKDEELSNKQAEYDSLLDQYASLTSVNDSLKDQLDKTNEEKISLQTRVFELEKKVDDYEGQRMRDFNKVKDISISCKGSRQKSSGSTQTEIPEHTNVSIQTDVSELCTQLDQSQLNLVQNLVEFLKFIY